MKNDAGGASASNDVLGLLPEWEPTLEFSERALDRFIYSQEPAGESAEEFRADLAAVIAEAVAAERERWQEALQVKREALQRASGWLHAAYDRPPQTPECIAMLAEVDAARDLGA